MLHAELSVRCCQLRERRRTRLQCWAQKGGGGKTIRYQSKRVFLVYGMVNELPRPSCSFLKYAKRECY